MSQEQHLKKVAGWGLLATLGVSYVISGDFAGWPYGIVAAGWGGMLIAGVLMGIMYFALVLSQAEMATAIPAAGGGYSFARFAMGPIGGYLTGLGILIEYAFAPAAIVVFIGGYVEALTGLNGPMVYAAFYVVFIGINLMGAGEALKLMLIITGLAVVAILVTAGALLPKFEVANLMQLPAGAPAGADILIPFGLTGVFAALPFGMWLFLGVEGIPLAAEECKDPKKDLPKGIIIAMLLLIVFGFLMLVVVPGSIGVTAQTAEAAVTSDAPLIVALSQVYGEASLLVKAINVIALAGLIASFFSLIFGCSRIIFALARAGYFPQFMAKLNGRKVPLWGLIVPGVLGFAGSLTGQGALMINIAVFGAALSYGMQALSHILLRINRPDMPRPYRTPGGVFTSSIALVLSIIAIGSCFANADMRPAAFYTLGVVAIGMVYFMLFRFKDIAKKTAEQEFSIIHDSEEELG